MDWFSNKNKSSAINEIVKNFERNSTMDDMSELYDNVKKFIESKQPVTNTKDKLHLNINNNDEFNIKMEFVLNNKVIGYTDNSGKITIFDVTRDYLKWKSDESRKISPVIVRFRNMNYFINSHGILSNENRYNNQIFDFVEGTTFSNIVDVNFVKDNHNKIPVIHLIK